MQIALQVAPTSYAQVLEAARYAESRDLAAFAIPDHFMYGTEDKPLAALDALAVLGGLTRDTRSIELVLLVSPVTIRHPAVLAKTAATLSDMSDGRVTMGVGTGWMTVEHARFGLPFPDQPARFAMLEEALAYLRAAFSDPPRDFTGEHYSFTAFDVRPRPPLRLLVGGGGPAKTPRLAGTYADEFNAYPSLFGGFEEKVERAREAAAAAGRDPAALFLSTSSYILGADTTDGVHAALEGLAEVTGRTPEQVEEGFRMRNAPHGTWDQVRDTLSGYEERGVQRLYVQAYVDDLATIEEKLAHLV